MDVNIYNIENGPNRSMLVDAFEYAHDGNVRLEPNFVGVGKEPFGSSTHKPTRGVSILSINPYYNTSLFWARLTAGLFIY